MANPKRNASGDRILSPSRTFFVTTRTSMGKGVVTVGPQRYALDRCASFLWEGRKISTAWWQNESEQGLKPNHSYTCAARLKPCPDTKHQGGDSRKPRVSSGTSSLKCRNSRPRTNVLG